MLSSRLMTRTIAAVALVGTLAPALAFAQPALLTPELVRSRVEREWSVKAKKMRTLLQPVMRKHGIDLWVIMSRENAPDPAVELFGGNGITGWYGHRNAYLFRDPGEGKPLETHVIGTHLSGHMKLFYDRLEPYGQEGLKPHLEKYIAATKPKRIAINQSRTISMADGLTASLKEYLVDAIGPDYAARLTSSEPMFVEYVSMHIPEEHDIQREASIATEAIIRRSLSNEVITPGKTRLMDVHYWITAEWKRQGFEFNFPASVDLQRSGGISLDDAENPVIERGDLLHVDFGVRSSGIVTDQQKMAYVLQTGEKAPPAGLVKAFADSVRAAALICEEIKPGRIGHEMKTAAEKRTAAAGLAVNVYSHVQGYWVHDAGVWINPDWPDRYGAHTRFKLLGGEWLSLEFSSTTAVPEWGGQRVRMMREEDLLIQPDGRQEFLSGPQTELWLVR
jgi:Xaa-Pro aminopeptidase